MHKDENISISNEKGKPTIVVTRAINGEDMSLEEVLAFLAVSIKMVAVQSPPSISQCLTSLSLAAADVIDRLAARGVVSGAEVIALVTKMSHDAVSYINTVSERSDIKEMVEGVKASIKSREDAVKKN